MKKGIQYSHYCGLELLELVCAIRNSQEMADLDMAESKRWGDYALKMVNQLRIKIGELDTLNNMKY